MIARICCCRDTRICCKGNHNCRINKILFGSLSYLPVYHIKLSTDPDDPQPNAADAILSDSTNSIKNGGLEASSTDVANEFAEMITTQRGYQANTRIITVTDSMLEELVNMKR